MDADMQAIADRLAIGDVLTRYATALDTRDWDVFATCFTPDVVAHYDPVEPRHGYEAFLELARGSLEGVAVTQHIVTNHVIDIAGDTATARSYAHAMHVRPGTEGGDQFVIAGTYEDELVRTAAGWVIRRRRFAAAWSSGNPRVVGLDPALLTG